MYAIIDHRSVVHAAAASMVEAAVTGQNHNHSYIHQDHPHGHQPIKSEPNDNCDSGTLKEEEKERKGNCSNIWKLTKTWQYYDVHFLKMSYMMCINKILGLFNISDI